MYLNTGHARSDYARKLVSELKSLLQPMRDFYILEENQKTPWDWTTIIIRDFTFNSMTLGIDITSALVTTRGPDQLIISLAGTEPAEMAVYLIEGSSYLKKWRKSTLEVLASCGEPEGEQS